MYRDEVIHFIFDGGEYLGKLEQSKHPNGEGWFRLNDPCHIEIVTENKVRKMLVTKVGGPKGYYRKFVDIRIPESSPIDIKVLDKGSDLMDTYLKETNRPALRNIVLPT